MRPYKGEVIPFAFSQALLETKSVKRKRKETQENDFFLIFDFIMNLVLI